MRSLLISHVYFPPQVGGISRIMARLATTLGPERICCLTGLATPGGEEPVARARVYRVPALFGDRPKWARAVPFARTMGTILLRERPRAVLVGVVEDSAYALWLKRWLGLPYAVYAHGNEICRIISAPDTHRLERSFLTHAARVLAVSRFTAGLVERAGVPPGRIVVANPGCDVETISAAAPVPGLRERLLGPRAAGPVILTTGNLVERKGHDTVIRALPEVLRAVPGATYLVAGSGPRRPALEQLAGELGVRDQVVFAGFLDDAELPALYHLASVFIMASRERPEDCDVEGFGLVFLEAGACGKPVIGGRSGGVPEAVLDGRTGLLVDPTSPAEVASALTRLLGNPALAAAMGREGAARARQEFSWSAAAERVDGILRSLA